MTFVEPPFWAYDGRGARGGGPRVTVSRVTLPEGAPLTLTQVKTHVKVPLDSTESDDELLRWIAAAWLDVEQFAQVRCLTESWDVTWPAFPRGRGAIDLPLRPLDAVTSLDYLDASGVSQTLDEAGYEVEAPVGDYPEPGRVMLAYGQGSWPAGPSMAVLHGVTVHCTVGYGAAAAVPGTLTAAMLLLIGHWWLNREAGAPLRGTSDFLPYGVDRLLQPFQRETLA